MSVISRSSHSVIQRPLVEAALAYLVFCGLSLLSRFIPPLFLLVLAGGTAFPLAWAKVTHNWEAIGFTRRHFWAALLWGAGAGLASLVYAVLVFKSPGVDFPPLLAIQLAAGLIGWFLIMSPFQEFFFRGWLQPRFESSLGKWTGLVITSLAFTLWHFCPPLEGTATSTLPITSATGVFSTFGLGLLWGYVFQRTGNIVAPWVAHSLGGLGLVLAGVVSFLQYKP